MPTSNKGWKPYFFFAWRRDAAGEVIPWDVPVRWRDDATLPEPEELSQEEGEALALLKATLAERPLPYSGPPGAAGRRNVGAKEPLPGVKLRLVQGPRLEEGGQSKKRSRSEAEMGPLLSPVPLAVRLPTESSSSEGSSRAEGKTEERKKKKKKIKGRGKDGAALFAATQESLRTFQAEEKTRAWSAEEEEFQRVLRESAAAPEERPSDGVAPEEAGAPGGASGSEPKRPEGSEGRRGRSVSSGRVSPARGGSRESSSSDSSGGEDQGRRPRAGASHGVRQDSIGGAAAAVGASAEVIDLTAAEGPEVSFAPMVVEAPDAEVSIPGVVVQPPVMEVSATKGAAEGTPAGAAASGAASAAAAADPEGGKRAEATGDAQTGVPSKRPKTLKDSLDAFIPDSVKEARERSPSVPRIKSAIPVSARGEGLRARVAQVTREQTKRMTQRSPLDAGSMGAAKGSQIARFQEVVIPSGLHSFGRSLAKPNPNADPQKVRAAEKEIALPRAPRHRRHQEGPRGREVRLEDVRYDLHALDSLPQLSERCGRPVLPGSGSHPSGNFVDLVRQVCSKLSADMLTLSRDVGSSLAELWEKEFDRAVSEARAEAFEEGCHSMEAEKFKHAALLDAEILRLKNRVYEAENVAGAATRKLYGTEEEAAKEKARADKAEAEVKELKDSALKTARAEVQAEKQGLEARAETAETNLAAVAAELAEVAARVQQSEEREAQVRRRLEVLEAEAGKSKKALSEEQARRAQLEESAALLQKKLGTASEVLATVRSKLDVAENEAAAYLARAESAEAARAECEDQVMGLNRQIAEMMKRFEAPRAMPVAPTVVCVEGAVLQQQLSEKVREVEELRVQLGESRFRETMGTAQGYNAAVLDIREAFPSLDFDAFFIDGVVPGSLPAEPAASGEPSLEAGVEPATPGDPLAETIAPGDSAEAAAPGDPPEAVAPGGLSGEAVAPGGLSGEAEA